MQRKESLGIMKVGRRNVAGKADLGKFSADLGDFS